MRLRLVVHNTDDLAGGYRAVYEFDEAGGVIGADAACDWQLGDRDGSVFPRHATVEFIDKQFCLYSEHEKALKINNSHAFIKPGQKIQVTDGDQIRVGRFELTAFVEMTLDESDEIASRGERWAKRFVSLGSLVDDEEEINAQNLFDAKPLRRKTNIEMYERIKQAQQVDPVDLIEEQFESRSTFLKDPVALIERESQAEDTGMATKIGNIINLDPENEHTKAQIPDDLQPGSAFMALPQVQPQVDNAAETAPKKQLSAQDRDFYLEQLAKGARSLKEAEHSNVGDIAVKDRYLSDLEMAEAGEEQLVDHVVLRPLCLALGLPVQSMSVPKANQLAKDIGDAFRAAVEGLMKVQKKNLSDKSHLAQTHLHAIEDNPLRHNKSSTDVIKDLLLLKSPVHLSAEAAFQESLEFIEHHQHASEVAAEEALDAVLRALSPMALAKRFKKYKGHAPRAGDLDSWHWEMYQHYYKEIRSEQQGGLSRMFWEVYRQVYDREMRNLTLEG